MEFQPPRCPNRQCHAHRHPTTRFYRRVGSYRPRCRTTSIPRFECRTCGKGFSYQTFRMDYRDRRPHDNLNLFADLVSGEGLRQVARKHGLDCNSAQMKFRKIARHLRILNRSLLHELPPNQQYCLDEAESFEHLSIAPLTIPVLVENRTKLVIATDVAPIRRGAKRGSRRERKLARFEGLHGRRVDRGRECVRRVFGRLARLLAGKPALLLTDKKPSYATECRVRFRDRVQHVTASSRLPRTPTNPLFPANLTEDMMRDNNGRLHRKSWLVSKRRRMLQLQLALFTAYRNWHRPRSNMDPRTRTPGALFGLCPHLELPELLAWRQDWGRRSIHPKCTTGSSSIDQFGA